ncbi:MAG: CPBP family intramembrane glutamic endopeptidase [Pseudomonadota bacterium]|nr:CPBP family intramembrane glutamic endopeptidase [Pseudomonadota bacterium]
MTIKIDATGEYAPKTVFWIFFSSFALLCLGYYFTYQQEIFPTISTPITMSAHEAEVRAVAINKASELQLDPREVQTSSGYVTDRAVNNYITLEAGGNKKLNALLEEDSVISSYWKVRVYIPSNPQEHAYFFAPDGRSMGFHIALPEAVERSNISKGEALQKIENYLDKNPLAGVNTDEYILKDYSQVKQSNGRVDHAFTYEHQSKHIEKARYKYEAKVSGDAITLVRAYIDVPEAFYDKYKSMRSSNELLSNIGNILVFGVYGMLMFSAVIYAWNKNKLDWYHAVGIAGVIVFMGALAMVNALPSHWFYSYNTLSSPYLFYIGFLNNVLHRSLWSFFFLSVTFLAGDYLTRMAFPHHINFWMAWRREASASWLVSEQIAIGYGLCCVSLGYIALFYTTVLQLPGVWSPSHNFHDPNIISDYVPFLGPISRSLHAGVWEEFLFRAVPLSAIAILGKRRGNVNLYLSIGIIIQAFIFGLAHASYPQQPSYIRMVELGIEFIIYGLVYLQYGLLPCIVSHYLFDVFAMSESLFFMQTPGIAIQQVGVICALSAPMLVHLVQKFLAGSFWVSKDLPKSFYNENWQPQYQIKPISQTTIPSKKLTIGSMIFSVVLVILTVCGLYVLRCKYVVVSPSLDIDKEVAISQAKNLAKDKLDMTKPWTITAVARENLSLDFINYFYEKEGASKTKDLLVKRAVNNQGGLYSLEHFMPKKVWHVRFANFEGSDVEKVESFSCEVSANERPVTFDHVLSEEVKRSNLSEEQSKMLFQKTMLGIGYQLDQLKVMNLDSKTHISDRTDRTITYRDNVYEVYPNLDLRWVLGIQGDVLDHVSNYLKVPEKWLDKQYINNELFVALKQIAHLFVQLVYFGLLVEAIKYISQGLMDVILLRRISLIVFLLYISFEINSLPLIMHNLSTTTPLVNQWLSLVFSTTMMSAFSAGLLSVLLCLCVTKQKRLRYKQSGNALFVTGICAGSFLGGCVLLTFYIFGKAPILTSNIVSLNTYIPSYNAFWGLANYAIFQCVFIQNCVSVAQNISADTKRAQWYRYIALALVVMVYYFVQSPADNLYQASSICAVFVLISSLLYYFYVSNNTALLPSIVAGFYTTTFLFRYMSVSAYPYAELHFTLSTLGLLGLGYGLTVLLVMHQHQEVKTL